MPRSLSPHQMTILYGDSGIQNEFSEKVQELDRRLKRNGMNYRDWDSLNDRQRDVFSGNLFLDGECASKVENYVDSGVHDCNCADTEEELHHHSPVLVRAIQYQRDQIPPSITLQVANANESLDREIDIILNNLPESEDR